MYPVLVTISLILVFGSSAFMSISGLLAIFTNNSIVIICMGLGMEIGKILTISHLYRTWQKNTGLVKTGYITIIFVLTFLTSFEVMGFLSQCHQKAIQSSQMLRSNFKALEKKEAVFNHQIQIIDQTLNGLPKSHVSRRINERKNSGYAEKQKQLIEIIRQRTNIEKQLILGGNNSNPILAIAKVLKIKESNVISIFIPLLVFILEPLAIGLTIATNSAWINFTNIPSPKTGTPNDQNLTDKLQGLYQDYDLSLSQIAKITGRKKLKTCEGWIKGTIPTPSRALAEIQAWVEKDYVKKPDE